MFTNEIMIAVTEHEIYKTEYIVSSCKEIYEKYDPSINNLCLMSDFLTSLDDSCEELVLTLCSITALRDMLSNAMSLLLESQDIANHIIASQDFQKNTELCV